MSFMILEAAVLAAALSLDGFVASFAYGSNKIYMPWQSVLVIDAVCSIVVGISLWLGALVRPFLPSSVTSAICFCILMVLGATKLLDSLLKAFIRKHGGINRSMGFSVSSVRLVLSVYADPESADVDGSKILSPNEAFSLALALSLDGMAVGFGAAMGNVSGWAVFACSLFTNALAVLGGCALGNKAATRLKHNISWVGGAVLILLAISKII